MCLSIQFLFLVGLALDYVRHVINNGKYLSTTSNTVNEYQCVDTFNNSLVALICIQGGEQSFSERFRTEG